jgi:hypothetical protein
MAMESMFSNRRSAGFIVAASFVLGSLVLGSASGWSQDESRGRKYKAPPATSEIHVTVIRDTTGKPIHNAAVVLHPLNKGKDEGAMEVKTDEDGKVALDIVPIGDVLRLQIIAPGYQTFGQDYPVDAPAKEIVVRMKRPGQQYSIYKAHGDGDQSAQTTAENKDQKSGNAQPPAPTTSTQTGPPE